MAQELQNRQFDHSHILWIYCSCRYDSAACLKIGNQTTY